MFLVESLQTQENDSSLNSNNWTWSINNLASTHPTGFWGPVEANHAFCEPHYAITPYIAEFFNSTSSIIYILLGSGFVVKFPNDGYIQTAQVWLVAVGIGSMLFHGTMRYVFQLTDEVPMVGFLSTLMIAKITAMQLPTTTAITLAIALVVLFSISLIAIYTLWNEYEIFIHGFTGMVLVDTVLTLSLLDRRASNKWRKVEGRAYLVSFFSIVLGRVAWESEHLLCPQYPQVWPLHVVWHLFSCLSAYAAMVNIYVIRARLCSNSKNVNKTLPGFVGFGNLIAAANKAKTE